MKRDLAQVLADARGEAAVCRRRGAEAVADALEQLAKDVHEAAEEWLVWLSESDAQLRSGFSVAWLRQRFPGWEREGHARLGAGRVRQYRACIIPRRAHLLRAAAQGADAARRRTA